MKFKDLQKKEERDLKELLLSHKDKLRDLRFKAQSKQLRKVQDVKNIRRTIARILTLLNQNKQKENNS